MSAFLITVKNKDGFMLFEAIVSVAILSLGLVLVLRSFTGSLQVARVSQNYMRAALLLEEKMGELERKGSLPPGTSRGEFSQGKEGFRWELEAAPVGDDSAKDEGSEEKEKRKLNEVRLTVSWFEGERIKQAGLTTYLSSEE